MPKHVQIANCDYFVANCIENREQTSKLYNMYYIYSELCWAANVDAVSSQAQFTRYFNAQYQTLMCGIRRMTTSGAMATYYPKFILTDVAAQMVGMVGSDKIGHHSDKNAWFVIYPPISHVIIIRSGCSNPHWKANTLLHTINTSTINIATYNALAWCPR